jgi:hypothetical protein
VCKAKLQFVSCFNTVNRLRCILPFFIFALVIKQASVIDGAGGGRRRPGEIEVILVVGIQAVAQLPGITTALAVS